MSDKYDVIVVGAGPGGGSAAYETASRGLKTLILEKKKLPRYKTCGGGLPMTLHKHLPSLIPEAFVESTVVSLRHTWNFQDAHIGEINLFPDEPPMTLWMVQRSIFDNALAQRAVKAGAELRDDIGVKSVEPDGENRVRVTAMNGDVYFANHVIGADGAIGVVARCAGLRQSRLLAIALEVEVPHRWGDGHESLRPEIAHLEYAVKKGYAWVFPKERHLSVGAGMFGQRSVDGRGEAKRDELVQWILGYLNALGVPKNEAQLEFHGHPLPIWNGSEPIDAWNGRVLLVGDAAGLVNPLFGDGISYACRSGILAGKAISDERASEWTSIVGQTFGPGHDAASTIAKFFYQFPNVCYKMGVKREKGTRIAARLISGDLGFEEVIAKLPWKSLMNRNHQTAW